MVSVVQSCTEVRYDMVLGRFTARLPFYLRSTLWQPIYGCQGVVAATANANEQLMAATEMAGQIYIYKLLS